MIARMLAAAHVAVHAGGNKALRQRRTEQKMIDAQTCVAGEGVTKILPERIDAPARVQLPQRVGPALRDKQAVGFPHLGPEQRVIDPSFRRVDVEIGRLDIVIPASTTGSPVASSISACAISRSNQRSL
jgi:hypothetical protein